MEKELIGILGAGESGIGAALLAVNKDFDVWVSEYSQIKEKYRNELLNNNIPFEEKGHSFEKLANAKWIVKSPGIPEHADIIQKLRSIDKEIISELEFASRFNDAFVVAVTGSNGKTTVSSLIYHLLRSAGKQVVLAGNIGKSFSRFLAEDLDFDVVVLEVSSFQLDDIKSFKPQIAVILNVTADHLDRYNYEIENYALAKWKICSNQDESDVLILNEDDYWINKLKIGVGSISKVVWLSVKGSKQGLTSTEVKHNLKGKHNDFNVTVAIRVLKEMGVDDDKINVGLRTFQAIEHRLETVAIIDGIEFVNDSKATNVDAVYYALDAMDRKIIWIAGGTDKGNDYSSIDELVNRKVKALVCMGLDNSKLLAHFGDRIAKLRSTDTIEKAVKEAYALADEGDVVLLSPACASFDLFQNYEHRGALFKKEIKKLID